MQNNSQDSVVIENNELVPLAYHDIEANFSGTFWQRIMACPPEEDKLKLNACICESRPSASVIKAAKLLNEEVPGTAVKRGYRAVFA